MLTVWKYPLTRVQNILDMPSGAKLLTVARQEMMTMLWVQVDTEAPMAKREITIHGTGHPIDRPICDYIGTYFADRYVWHVYDHGEFIE